MAKAQITSANGTKIVIEGSPEEVAQMLERLQGQPEGESGRAAPTRTRKRAKSSPVGVIAELIEGGFFKKPKELRAIKDALEEQGHFYPVTTISPTVLRLVKKKELRRIKEDKRWKYVG